MFLFMTPDLAGPPIFLFITPDLAPPPIDNFTMPDFGTAPPPAIFIALLFFIDFAISDLSELDKLPTNFFKPFNDFAIIYSFYLEFFGNLLDSNYYNTLFFPIFQMLYLIHLIFA